LTVTATKSPAIVIKQAALSIGSQIIFDRLNCEIAASKFTCLLGPSGVGKSMLLHMIAGIVEIENAKIAGQITASDTLSLRHRIAYMGQTDLLLPWLSVLKNTLLGVRLRHQMNDEKNKQARQLLAQVGLTAAIDKRPAELSGGMRQRVALVRTLIEDKPIILMDEPFSALDAITRLNLQDLAAKLLKGKTVLLVTHDPLEALRLGDVVYVMTGRPAHFGTPIQPTGNTPRETTNQQILALQGELLVRLELAQKAMQ